MKSENITTVVDVRTVLSIISASPLNISVTLVQRFHSLGNIKSLFFDLLIPFIESFKTSDLSIQIYGGCNAYSALQACTNVGCSDINLVIFYQSTTLRKECPYLELFWSVFSLNAGEY